MQGRVDKIAKTMALLEQPYIKDSGKTVAGAWPTGAGGSHALGFDSCGVGMDGARPPEMLGKDSMTEGAVQPPCHVPQPPTALATATGVPQPFPACPAHPCRGDQGGDCRHRREHPDPPL